MPAGQDGLVVIRLPLPPGTMATIWGDDERFKDTYWSRFPGVYFAGDGAKLDEDGEATENGYGRKVAVEVNGAIVPRSLHAEHALKDGDRIEIVHALGGG